MNSLKPVEVQPIYLFFTGGGSPGHLIKTIYHTAVKTFRHPPFNPELPTVLLMAPTGVAAINIDGTTINTGFAIPKETGDYLPAMSDQRKTVQSCFERLKTYNCRHFYGWGHNSYIFTNDLRKSLVAHLPNYLPA